MAVGTATPSGLRQFAPWLIAGVVLVGATGAAAPTLALGLLMGVVILGWAASSPRFGVAASVVTSLLIPLPLAFKLGPISLTFGRLVGFAFLVGWLAALSRPDGPVPRRTGVEIGIAAFTFSLLISLAVNSPHLSNLEVTAAIRRILVFAVDYFAFFVAAASVLRAGWQHLDRILRIVCGVVVMMGLIGLVERITGHNIYTYIAPALPGGARTYVASLAAGSSQTRGGSIRIQATTEGPNEFGAVIVMTLPLIVHYSTVAVSSIRRSLWILGAAVCIVAGFYTQSRSVVIGLVLDVLVYGALTLRSRIGVRRTVLIALALVAIFAIPSFRNNFSAYFRGAVSAQDTSVTGRQFQANYVLSQFPEHPFFGTGPQTLSEQEFVQRGQTVHITTDDSYLQTLGEQGLFGLVSLAGLFLGFLLLGFHTVARSPPGKRSLPAALVAAAVCFVVLTYLFDMLDLYGETKLFFFLMAALVALRTMEHRGSDDRSVAIADPRWLLHTMSGRRRTLTRWAMLGAIGAGLSLVLFPAPYQASAQVLIQQPAALLQSANSASIWRDGVKFLPTYAEAARSDTVLRASAAALGTTLTPDDLRSVVSAIPVPNALILTITASQRHAAGAVQLARLTAEHFVQAISSVAPQQGQTAVVLSVGPGTRTGSRTLSTPLIILLSALGLAALHCFGSAYRESVLTIGH